MWDYVEAEMRLCGSCTLDRVVHAEARFFPGNAIAFIACPRDSCSWMVQEGFLTHNVFVTDDHMINRLA
ncbi:hypothetical protein KR100_08415 [Synechococcus sp. KORDI-100]|nr:hypothetical protein KR100_08415 [Synechococcus sp. KORDI-100]